MTPRSHPRSRRLARLCLFAPLAAVAVGAPATADATSASPALCRPTIDKGVLPPWARGGFSSPKPQIPHATAKDGSIMGILFGPALVSPPAKRFNNKILWVANVGSQSVTDLTIHAQRMVGSRPVGSRVLRVVQGGPGPSIVDMPAAGCWRFDLRWAGHRDTVDLRYRADAPSTA